MTKKKRKEEFLRVARERFKTIQTEQAENRRKYTENIKFTYNIEDSQWPSGDLRNRKENKRPALIHNKVKKYVKSIANQEKEQRLAQKVKPIDDKADPAIAEILTGYIRVIEHQSDAQEIYTKQGENAAAGGFGYWRILTKYVDDSFDQEIYIQGFDNPLCVYLDSKGRYAFIREGMTKDEFKAQYPDSKEPIDFDSQSMGEGYELWFEKDKVFVAEYFFKEPYEKTLAEVISADDIDGKPEVIEIKDGQTVESLEAQGLKVLRTRKQRSHKIKWCKITGNDVIDGWDDGEIRDWPGNEIPIIEVQGESVNVEGKTYKMALIEDMKGPQQTYNYFITAQTERISLFPKAPYLVTPEQLGKFKPLWDRLHLENRPYLLYNQIGKSKPYREPPPNLDPGAAYMTDIADRDISDTLGRYEASFGDKSNERTGKAIIARANRSDMQTYHFPYNVAKAIKKTARMLIDLIPKVISSERVLRTRDYRGAEAWVEVNKTVLNPETGEMEIINDLSLGRYDVEEDIKVWSTRREEAAAEMAEAMQYAPQLAPIIAKYKFKYSDAAGAQELADEIDRFIEEQRQAGMIAQNMKQVKRGGL